MALSAQAGPILQSTYPHYVINTTVFFWQSIYAQPHLTPSPTPPYKNFIHAYPFAQPPNVKTFTLPNPFTYPHPFHTLPATVINLPATVINLPKFFPTFHTHTVPYTTFQSTGGRAVPRGWQGVVGRVMRDAIALRHDATWWWSTSWWLVDIMVIVRHYDVTRCYPIACNYALAWQWVGLVILCLNRGASCHLD